MFIIYFYENDKGKSEVLDYLDSLRKNKSKENIIKLNKIIAYLDALEKHGLALGEPYIKKIDSDIWELRPLKDRLLFASFCGGKFIILTHFIKKTQKTPISEINKAKRFFKNYIERNK